MSSPNKRREMDVIKLMMSDYKVEMVNDCLSEFSVEFHGPKDSPYQDGTWKVRVRLPNDYPYKSPSIAFVTRIFHPNVHENSGTVCLDVINRKWSAMFDLFSVFEVFLPQLLLYPNPAHPLNRDAGLLMMRDREKYEQKVKEYCERYAKGEDAGSRPAADDEEPSEVEGSEEESSSDEETADHHGGA